MLCYALLLRRELHSAAAAKLLNYNQLAPNIFGSRTLNPLQLCCCAGNSIPLLQQSFRIPNNSHQTSLDAEHGVESRNFQRLSRAEQVLTGAFLKNAHWLSFSKGNGPYFLQKKVAAAFVHVEGKHRCHMSRVYAIAIHTRQAKALCSYSTKNSETSRRPVLPNFICRGSLTSWPWKQSPLPCCASCMGTP